MASFEIGTRCHEYKVASFEIGTRCHEYKVASFEIGTRCHEYKVASFEIGARCREYKMAPFGIGARCREYKMAPFEIGARCREYKMASFGIGARCLFNFRNERFFLLVEDEIKVPDKGVEIDPVNIYEIDEQTFNFIRDEGDTHLCVPVDTLPTVPPGFKLERKCIFTVNNAYFVIFDLEDGTDKNVILRISAALFNSLKNSGVRECIPQNFIK